MNIERLWLTDSFVKTCRRILEENFSFSVSFSRTAQGGGGGCCFLETAAMSARRQQRDLSIPVTHFCPLLGWLRMQRLTAAARSVLLLSQRPLCALGGSKQLVQSSTAHGRSLPLNYWRCNIDIPHTSDTSADSFSMFLQPERFSGTRVDEHYDLSKVVQAMKQCLLLA